MEDFKKDNFYRAYPGEEYPSYNICSEEEARLLLEKICEKYSCSFEMPLALNSQVIKRSRILDFCNADDDEFSLEEVFERLSITPNDNIYISWLRLENVYTFNFKILCKRWDDIWYPAIDDIELFDDSFSWLIGINHHGYIILVNHTDPRDALAEK